MPIGTATAIGLGGAALSAFGGKDKKTTSEQKSGFQALPKEVQDFLLKSYLPQVQQRFESPYQAIPMQRAANPAGDPFASQGLYDLQQFSDVQGGYFTPRNGGLNQASYGQTGGLPPVPETSSTELGGGGDALVDQFLQQANTESAKDIARGVQTGGTSRDALAEALRRQNFGQMSVDQLDINALLRGL